MAESKGAVRQRYAVATGGNPGLPAPSARPRAKAGGHANIDTGGFQKYGNGFRRTGKAKK